MIKNLIYGFVTLLIGVSFLGPLNDMVSSVINNLTGFAKTVTGLITGFFAMALVAVGVALIVRSFGSDMN